MFFCFQSRILEDASIMCNSWSPRHNVSLIDLLIVKICLPLGLPSTPVENENLLIAGRTLYKMHEEGHQRLNVMNYCKIA